MKRTLMILLALFSLALLASCGEDDTTPAPVDELGFDVGAADDFGKTTLEGTGYTDPQLGKEDSLRGRLGPQASSFDNKSTQVWEAKNAWEDTDTAAARAAGMAWSENSGLNWDEKYMAWVTAMERTPAESFGDTFMITTPYGVELPAPSLECAEVAMFLRIIFASWYNLPWYMEGRDRSGNRLYFGHFGIRTNAGRFARTPHFRDSFEDFSKLAEDVAQGFEPMPSDPDLASRKLAGTFDDSQPMIGPDAHLGAYLDALLLNKRVGHFIMIQLLYFGSINLADASNTFNVAPEHTAAGDVLLERWQRRGIGHTLVVMRARRLGTQVIGGEELPLLDAELASGSMPRRQPVWESAASSKRSFTLEEAGGKGFVHLQGGLKRWRIAKKVGSNYRNAVISSSQDAFIQTWRVEQLEARPERFSMLLEELSAQEKLETLIGIIEAKRRHLEDNPSSCSARIAREGAFKDLYEVAADPQIGWSREKVDRELRTFEDYVFAELVYTQSKTCCWNSTNRDMYDVAVEFARREAFDTGAQQCSEVHVFKNLDDNGDGYERYRDLAREMGLESSWVTWRADESCGQRDVREDTEAEHGWTGICDL